MIGVELTAHVAAGLVMWAGVGKLARPHVARDALRLRTAASAWMVRAFGIGEVALASAVLLIGGTVPFALLAGAYLGFAVAASRLRRAGRGCGCFGASTGTVGPLHLVVDVAAGVVAAVAALGHTPGVVALLPGAPAPAVATLVLLVLAVFLAKLTLTELPELLVARVRLLGGPNP